MNHSRLKSKSGFTLIELLVTITIMIVLTAIGVVSYQNATRNARNGRRKTDLETVRSALVLYRTDTGAYPVGSDVSGAATNNSMNAAVTALNADGYVSNNVVADPDNAAPYKYYYSSDTVTFTLCGALEPDPGLAYCISNP